MAGRRRWAACCMLACILLGCAQQATARATKGPGRYKPTIASHLRAAERMVYRGHRPNLGADDAQVGALHSHTPGDKHNAAAAAREDAAADKYEQYKQTASAAVLASDQAAAGTSKGNVAAQLARIAEQQVHFATPKPVVHLQQEQQKEQQQQGTSAADQSGLGAATYAHNHKPGKHPAAQADEHHDAGVSYSAETLSTNKVVEAQVAVAAKELDEVVGTSAGQQGHDVVQTANRVTGGAASVQFHKALPPTVKWRQYAPLQAESKSPAAFSKQEQAVNIAAVHDQPSASTHGKQTQEQQAQQMPKPAEQQQGQEQPKDKVPQNGLVQAKDATQQKVQEQAKDKESLQEVQVKQQPQVTSAPQEASKAPKSHSQSAAPAPAPTPAPAPAPAPAQAQAQAPAPAPAADQAADKAASKQLSTEEVKQQAQVLIQDVLKSGLPAPQIVDSLVAALHVARGAAEAQQPATAAKVAVAASQPHQVQPQAKEQQPATQAPHTADGTTANTPVAQPVVVEQPKPAESPKTPEKSHKAPEGKALQQQQQQQPQAAEVPKPVQPVEAVPASPDAAASKGNGAKIMPEPAKAKADAKPAGPIKDQTIPQQAAPPVPLPQREAVQPAPPHSREDENQEQHPQQQQAMAASPISQHHHTIEVVIKPFQAALGGLLPGPLGSRPGLIDSSACQKPGLSRHEADVAFEGRQGKLRVTTVAATCASATPALPTLGGGCSLKCDFEEDLSKISLVGSQSFTALADFTPGDSKDLPAACSYQAEAALRGKCKAVLKLACCGDTTKTGSSPPKAQVSSWSADAAAADGLPASMPGALRQASQLSDFLRKQTGVQNMQSVLSQQQLAQAQSNLQKLAMMLFAPQLAPEQHTALLQPLLTSLGVADQWLQQMQRQQGPTAAPSMPGSLLRSGGMSLWPAAQEEAPGGGLQEWNSVAPLRPQVIAEVQSSALPQEWRSAGSPGWMLGLNPWWPLQAAEAQLAKK